MDDKEKNIQKVSEDTQKTADRPRYNKTWEAVLKFHGSVKVNDPTLFYR